MRLLSVSCSSRPARSLAMPGPPAVEGGGRSAPVLSGFRQELTAHPLHCSVQLLADEFYRQPTVSRDRRPGPAGQPLLKEVPFLGRESTQGLLVELDPGRLLAR